MSTQIIPAIMPFGMLDLREKMTRVANFFSMLQIDACDGVFVPTKTWPYLEGRGSFDKLVRGEEEMPFWDKLDFEIDLMIRNPERDLSNWIAAGASRLIVHVESTGSLPEIVAQFGKGGSETAATPMLEGAELVLALNVTTDNAVIEPYVEQIHAVQFMGIAEIGSQGNPFDDRVLPKIAELHGKYPDLPISVDGGVNYESAPMLLHAGATRLVSGSTIFNSVDLEETIRRLSGNV